MVWLTSGVRGHSWPVLRPEGAVQGGWRCARHQLPLHGRLCGPRLLQCGDFPTPAGTEGECLVIVIVVFVFQTSIISSFTCVIYCSCQSELFIVLLVLFFL